MKTTIQLLFYIQFISTFINSQNCVTSNYCNIVNNGGFEKGIYCGGLNNIPANCPNQLVPKIDCWEALHLTPDYYVRNCIDSICMSLSLVVPTSYYTPIVDTHNNSDSTSNDKMLGLQSINYSPNTLNEGIQVSLQRPLLPNISYKLKFAAHIITFGVFYDDFPGVLVFAGSNNLLPQTAITNNQLPSLLTQLSQNTIPNNGNWNYFETEIINTSSSSLNSLSIINAGFMNNNPTGTTSYILIDDISIIENDYSIPIGKFDLPNEICIGESISNLSLFISDLNSNGIFEGEGVNFDGVNYNFNTSELNSGKYPISYIYQTQYGCLDEIQIAINVENCAIINEKEINQKILFYPNPSSNDINIQLINFEKNVNLKIFNLSGNELLNKNIENQYVKIDISNFSKGIYFIEIGNKREKLVIE